MDGYNKIHPLGGCWGCSDRIRQDMDLNEKTCDGPRKRAVFRLRGHATDGQSLLVCVVKFVRQTVVTVNERTKIVAEGKPMPLCGFVGTLVLIGINAPPKGYSIAV